MTDDDVQFLHQALGLVLSGGPVHDFRSPEFRRVLALIDHMSAPATSGEQVDYVLRSLGLSSLRLIIERYVQSMAAQREACLALDAARRSTPLQ